MSTYDNPVKVEFGRGSLDFLPRFIQQSKVLLLTSPTFVKNGTVDKIRKMVHVNQVISNIKTNPTIGDIEKIRTTLDFQSFDKIIALGGGSVIDTAKAISPYDHSGEIEIIELLKNGFEKVKCEFKPIVAIPTTAGTGSEVTMWGTIWDEKNKLKYSISDYRLYCEAAILDPILHLTLPSELTIQTGLDALSHSLEALWNKNANPTSDTYAIVAIKSIITNLPKLQKNLADISLREELLVASYRAGLAFSNTQTALAHAMSYYMTLHKGIPHGIAASFTLPNIIKVGMKDEAIKRKLIDALGTNPQSAIENLFKKLKISIVGAEYGLQKEDWNKILISLRNTSRASNSVINPEEVISLFKKEG